MEADGGKRTSDQTIRFDDPISFSTSKLSRNVIVYKRDPMSFDQWAARQAKDLELSRTAAPLYRTTWSTAATFQCA